MQADLGLRRTHDMPSCTFCCPPGPHNSECSKAAQVLSIIDSMPDYYNMTERLLNACKLIQLNERKPIFRVSDQTRLKPAYLATETTVDLKIFVRILFSRIALKVILVTAKVRDQAMIYLYQLWTECFRHFARILFLQSFTKIKTSRKISNLQ